MNTSQAQSTFLSSELRRALDEQSFGIITYTLIPSTTALQAAATVTLLEGKTIVISLSARGYRVGNYSTYESLDALLQAISPMYAGRRQELLIRRLEALSRR